MYRRARYHGKCSPWVFHHELTRARHVAGERIRSLHRGFASAARRAELPEGLHQHDLRHRRVTTWLADGHDLVKVQEAIGHSDIRTTKRYTHLAREHLRSLVEPLWVAHRREMERVGAGLGNVVKNVVNGACDVEEGQGKFVRLKELDGWPSG